MRIGALVNSMRGDERPFLRGLKSARMAVRRFCQSVRARDFLPYRPEETNVATRGPGCLLSAFVAVSSVLILGTAAGLLALVWLAVYVDGQRAGVW